MPFLFIRGSHGTRVPWGVVIIYKKTMLKYTNVTKFYMYLKISGKMQHYRCLNTYIGKY